MIPITMVMDKSLISLGISFLPTRLGSLSCGIIDILGPKEPAGYLAAPWPLLLDAVVPQLC